MKITLDIPDGIVAGFFNGVEVTVCSWFPINSALMI